VARDQLSPIDGPVLKFQHAVCTALAARNTVYGSVNKLVDRDTTQAQT